jgi:hypothetical protein
MTERSSSEDDGQRGEWKTIQLKTLQDAWDQVESLGLRPTTIEWSTLAGPGQPDEAVLTVYYKYFK